MDPKNSILYWGDVGPDAGGADPARGPAGFDEVEQAKHPGFHGWPYFRGDNKAYAKIDFVARDRYAKEKSAYDKEKAAHDKAVAAYAKAVKEAKEAVAAGGAGGNSSGQPAPVEPPAWTRTPPKPYTAGTPVFPDPQHPVNSSPFNTGLKELPPAQPAFIFYPNGQSTRFPVVNGGGGRTAMAGPVYYYDPESKSPTKLPKEFDHTLFIYEWSRNWIIAVHLDANDDIAKNPDGSKRMERFCPHMTFKRPMDVELGADGCLYLIEFGTAWGNNTDTQIVRIEYHPEGTASVSP